MARHNNTDKEWGALLYWAINLSYISYEPKINSRTVQGERNGGVARISTGGQYEEGN